MPTTNASLREVFTAAEIASVIWIDDKFDTAHQELDVVAVRQVAAIALAAGQLPLHASLSDLTLQMSAEQWAAAILELASRDPQTAREAFAGLTTQVAFATDEEADYNDDEIEAIFASFGELPVERVGREKWLQERERIKGSVTAETLVLVDREFQVAGVVSRLGDEILREFATLTTATNLVMLTRSFTREDAAAATDTLSNELQIDRIKFAVMSKHRTAGGAADTEEQLRRSFRVVFTQRACVELARAVVSEIQDEIKTTFTQLSSESVFELDRAVFQNSLSEGASELDVIARIFMLRQRVRTQMMWSSSETTKRELRRIRRLRQLEDLPPMAERQPSTRLLEWRRDEVFDPAARVNATRSPLANGDVFQCGASTYVLLAQDCDLVVRPNGSRAATEGFLVRARPVTGEGAVELEDKQSFYTLPALLDDSAWRLDLRVWAAVSLCCLDLAVFNDDGSLTASATMAHSELLLPGWRTKAEKVRQRLQNAASSVPSEFRALSVGALSKVTPHFADGVLTFSYRRAGRLRSPWAVASYAAFTAYHTRAAFDHNFAKGLT